MTSRSRLAGLVAADGARPLSLDLLTTAEAHELLARRLGRAKLASDRAAAGEIIQRCARLPLALAIAVAPVPPQRRWVEARGGAGRWLS